MMQARAAQSGPTMLIAVGETPVDVMLIARRAASLGCSAVELVAGPASISSDWNAMRAELAANNLRCAGVALSSDDTNLGAIDAGSRSKARERIMAAIHTAREMGASYIRIGVARLDAPKSRYEDAWHYSIEALLTLRHEAGLCGIRVLVNLAGHGFLNTPPEARRFLDAVNSPWVGGSIDIAGRGGTYEAADWIETLTHRLVAVRVDGRGAAALDWSGIGRTLAAERFDGFIIAPFDGGPNIDERLISVARAFDAAGPPV